jgi:hypothetical protein|tara:strand:- start:1623 stop:1919 length:297 start_codon:yes stop_codon:yes gene_type:complete
MNKYFKILFLTIMVAGCSSPRVLFKEDSAKFIRPPLPAKMELRDVDWRFFNAQSNTWFALDNENYLKLSKNMVDMAEYLQKLRIVIQTYETNRVELSE